jgi:hypothetical protein
MTGITDGAESTPLQIHIAKLVTSTPVGTSKEIYFARLCPQIIILFRSAVAMEDIVLQKVCVMIITRISHLNPSTCDCELLTPIAAALQTSHGRGVFDILDSTGSHVKSKKIHVKEKDSSHIMHVDSRDDIASCMCTLHALVTLCPLQPPLVASIQRSKVGKAVIVLCLYLMTEFRNSPLSPIAKEFCFQYFANTIDVSETALQLEEVIFYSSHTTSAVTNTVGKSNGKTAEELTLCLGITKPTDSSKVIDSPEELLSMLQSETKQKDESHYNPTIATENERNEVEGEHFNCNIVLNEVYSFMIGLLYFHEINQTKKKWSSHIQIMLKI